MTETEGDSGARSIPHTTMRDSNDENHQLMVGLVSRGGG